MTTDRYRAEKVDGVWLLLDYADRGDGDPEPIIAAMGMPRHTLRQMAREGNKQEARRRVIERELRKHVRPMPPLNLKAPINAETVRDMCGGEWGDSVLARMRNATR